MSDTATRWLTLSCPGLSVDNDLLGVRAARCGRPRSALERRPCRVERARAGAVRNRGGAGRRQLPRTDLPSQAPRLRARQTLPGPGAPARLRTAVAADDATLAVYPFPLELEVSFVPRGGGAASRDRGVQHRHPGCASDPRLPSGLALAAALRAAARRALHRAPAGRAGAAAVHRSAWSHQCCMPRPSSRGGCRSRRPVPG